MKRSIISLVLLLILTVPSFAMGGSPAPKDQGEPKPASSTREEELIKAKIEVKQMKAELEKIENYIWVLDQKIIDARKAKNIKKLVQLKEKERETIERAELLQSTIERKKEMYPELKASEDLEAVNAKAAIPENPTNPAEIMPKASGSMIYHDVAPGETLMAISRKYYGNASYYKDIAKLNGLADYNLRKGMKLKIDLSIKKPPNFDQGL